RAGRSGQEADSAIHCAARPACRRHGSHHGARSIRYAAEPARSAIALTIARSHHLVRAGRRAPRGAESNCPIVAGPGKRRPHLADGARAKCWSRPVIVDVFHFERVLLDEVAAVVYFFANERAEDEVRLAGLVGLDLEEGTALWVEGGFPEFVAVHFAEALEAGDGHAALAEAADLRHQVAELRQDAANVAVFQDETRRRLTPGKPRCRHQIRSSQAKLTQPIQSSVHTTHLVQLLHRKTLRVAVPFCAAVR